MAVAVVCMYAPLSTRSPEARDDSCEDLETFELTPSVWKLVQQSCPEEEASEVKRIIGVSLIEESCDLYAEVSLKDAVSEDVRVGRMSLPLPGCHVAGDMGADEDGSGRRL